MEGETFYGVTLSEKEPLAQFEVAVVDKFERDQKLIIKQVILGADAKEGEFNVVQAETRISDEEEIKIPIAVLKVGETRMLKPNVEFPSASVTFKLIQGTGPVYIHGKHVVWEPKDMEGEWFLEEEEVSDNEDIVEEHEIVQTNGKSNKRKL